MKSPKMRWLLEGAVMTIGNLGLAVVVWGPHLNVLYFGALSMLFTFNYLINKELYEKKQKAEKGKKTISLVSMLITTIFCFMMLIIIFTKHHIVQ